MRWSESGLPRFPAPCRKSLAALLFCAAPVWCQPQVLVTGLQGPHKIILTPRGNLLVSETNMAPNLGRISIVTRGGTRRSLLEGLPSGTEVTLAGGSGPNAMALRERTLYFTMGAGDSERRGQTPGTSIHNPAGVSSPIFASLLECRFSIDPDLTSGTFRMTPQHQQALADASGLPKRGNRADILRAFSLQARRCLVFQSGLVLATDGLPTLPTRKPLRTALCCPLPGRQSDAVPTSVRTYGASWLSDGFPFAPGNTGRSWMVARARSCSI